MSENVFDGVFVFMLESIRAEPEIDVLMGLDVRFDSLLPGNAQGFAKMTMICGFGWFLFAIWAGLAVPPTIWFFGRSLKRQSDFYPDPPVWPKVSIIVPARDEEHKIEEGLRSLLGCDYPNFELIAVDDRSRDATGPIMDRLSAEFDGSTPEKPRLKVVHIRELPEGWLGKNHALHVGASQSIGEWILFTDGDVVHQADTLRRCIRFAEARKLDHLPLFPNIEAHSIVEAAFVACFALVFASGTQPGLARSRFLQFYVGVGAFNLVRRSALQRAGGFEPIRLDILDDVKLGKLLKRTGSHAEVLRAANGLNIRWQQSAWKCITGLEKNAFASANYSILRLAWMLSVMFVVFIGPLIGTLLPGNDRMGYLAALIVSHAIYGANSLLFGHSFWIFPLLIPACLGFIFAFIRSAWITFRQNGVKWRDTFYSLELLRKNIYR